MAKLDVIETCQGCGVCCFHMGYPPFIRPDAQQDGEVWWHRLPDELRQELDDYIAAYSPRTYGETVDTFDGPCVWLDLQTRLCKHHSHRPSVCRQFEAGSIKCHEWRHFYRDEIEVPEDGKARG